MPAVELVVVSGRTIAEDFYDEFDAATAEGSEVAPCIKFSPEVDPIETVSVYRRAVWGLKTAGVHDGFLKFEKSTAWADLPGEYANRFLSALDLVGAVLLDTALLPEGLKKQVDELRSAQAGEPVQTPGQVKAEPQSVPVAPSKSSTESVEPKAGRSPESTAAK